MSEHPFAQYVRILGRGRKAARSLTYDEARAAMGMILKQEIEDVQLGAFLMLLRIKDESPEELAGFTQATRDFIQRPQQALAQLDWPSYAGRKTGQSLYVLSMLLLAENGVTILCHGSKGHTAQRSYTEDIFASLQVPIAKSLSDAEMLSQKNTLIYLPLAHFCQELEGIMHLRNSFGLRSPVHSFSKLINPGLCPAMLVPTFHPSYKPVHQAAAQILEETQLSVFKGDSGEAQRRPQAILSVDRLKDGQACQEKCPALLSDNQSDKSENDVDVLIQIWRSQNTDLFSQQAIIGTCALALQTVQANLSQEECLQQAEHMWADRNRALI